MLQWPSNATDAPWHRHIVRMARSSCAPSLAKVMNTRWIVRIRRCAWKKCSGISWMMAQKSSQSAATVPTKSIPNRWVSAQAIKIWYWKWSAAAMAMCISILGSLSKFWRKRIGRLDFMSGMLIISMTYRQYAVISIINRNNLIGWHLLFSFAGVQAGRLAKWDYHWRAVHRGMHEPNSKRWPEHCVLLLSRFHVQYRTKREPQLPYRCHGRDFCI